MKKYFILPANRFETIDWPKTYESELTIKWRVDLTEFIVSTDMESNYLIDELNYDEHYIRGIFRAEEWGNIDLPQ